MQRLDLLALPDGRRQVQDARRRIRLRLNSVQQSDSARRPGPAPPRPLARATIFLMTATSADGIQVGEAGRILLRVSLGDDDESLVLGGQRGVDGGSRVGTAHR